MHFKLYSSYEPKGDQPEAIRQLVSGINSGRKHQVLLGVTGSGKTFTIANVIEQVQKPTLILSHNKTLASQLYQEFKSFFPENIVEFFISHYDYYQPEAYIPSTDTYIEKDLAINDLIERMRLRAVSALVSGRRDIIIVSSVSCIYGLANPDEFKEMLTEVRVGDNIGLDRFLYLLIDLFYERSSEEELLPGRFRVRGDTLDVFQQHSEAIIRFSFWDDEIESIEVIDPETGRRRGSLKSVILYPANIFAISRPTLNRAVVSIQKELVQQLQFFQEQGKLLEANRLKERVEHDLDMITSLGYCKGIENYSRHFDGRKPGEPPYTLLDYFPDDFLLVVDESHVTIPQVRGMYNGDRARKLILVEHGFRLPSALDNRPLNFEEFESKLNDVIYMSATPGDYELYKSEGVIVEQIVRPTGLVDPPVEIRPTENQVEDLIGEINKVIEQDLGRVLVTTLTKRMAEELSEYLNKLGINATYIHSDIDALSRVDILRNLRAGSIDVLIGVNLLREGLDLPEVCLVAILDADKEGFLRSTTSFIQIAGRAARNVNGYVILYADKITNSIRKMLEETERRRQKQIAYNKKHGIKPRSVVRPIEETLTSVIYEVEEPQIAMAKETDVKQLSKKEINKKIKLLEKKMYEAVEIEEYLLAAKYRDEIEELKKLLQKA